MTANTTYTCNLCGQKIDFHNDTASEFPVGFGLRWTCAPPGNDMLVTAGAIHESPIHLHEKCIRRVAEIREELLARKLISKERTH